MANRKNQAMRLSLGINPLSYQGVNPLSPTNFIIQPRAPLPSDSHNVFIGDVWLDNSNENLPNPIPPVAENYWVLVALDKGVATWVNFAGGGDLKSLTGNSGGPVFGDAAHNINTVGDGTTIIATGNPATHTITWSASGSIATSYPTDNGIAVPAFGVLNIIAGNFTQNCGSTVEFTGSGNTVELNVTDANNNTIVGKNCGNATGIFSNNVALGNDCFPALTSGIENTAVGSFSLTSVTSGNANTAVGTSSLRDLTTGINNDAHGLDCMTLATTAHHNTAYGAGALRNLLSGSENVIIGSGAGGGIPGQGYLGAESSNIVIGGAGLNVVTGESNTTRIGASGGGSAQQNRCFIGGINGVNVGSVASVVSINNTGSGDQLGSTVITAGTNISVVPGVNTITINATGSAGAFHGFSASNSGATANVTGDGTPFTVIYDLVSYDTNAEYNNATGVFTASVAGKYQFNATAQFTNIGPAHTLGFISFSLNGGAGSFGMQMSPAAVRDSNNITVFTQSTIFNLGIGDTIQVIIRVDNSTKTVGTGGPGGEQYFQGFLIK